MSDGFEVYRRQRFAPSSEPFVTIQRKGILSLNRSAYDALGAPETVELLYNRGERLIGIRKVKRGLEHAYNVRSAGSTEMTWTVSGKGFLKFYGIDVPQPVRRRAHIKDGVLVVDLKDRGVVASPGRQKA